MRSGLRVAALFVAYTTVGFGGDYMVGLLASDRAVTRSDREVDVDVQVDVLVRTDGECAFELDRRLTIPISGATVLEIEAGAGALNVEGREDLDEIVAVGRVCASHRDLVDGLLLEFEREGDGIELSAHYPERGFRGGSTARIDLSVSIPMGMDVDIDDSSGEMSVSGVGNLDIEDSSGSIRVAGVAGSVRIDDSSGGIEVAGVAGDVEIEDGSGGIAVQGIAGTVAVRDGSGGIEISDVAADVLIEVDGSGGIDVRNVGGDFVVDRDGSGAIRHQGVAGIVDVPEPRR